LLARARAELRRGNAVSAQQMLEQMRVKFPSGVLGQEREVLSIEVLAARGNGDAARRRARAFIAAYPKSPHSAQLARFAEGP
jgi:outer membrane protein assembly factor BamD (BamD/ComL family)